MVRPITATQYNKAHEEAALNSGFLVSEAFQSAYFNSKGRETHESEKINLIKYFDTHHDARLGHIKSNLLKNQLSLEEFLLLDKILEKARNFSVEKEISFTSNNAAILRAIFQLRVLQSFSGPDLNGKKILEIGPGSGWLSCLLALSGAEVYSVEITQSHYIFQSILFASLFDENFKEHAISDGQNIFEIDQTNQLNHLPWWKICTIPSSLPQFDFVVSNHMLMETSNWALMFYCSFINRKLAANGKWIVEGIGAPYIGGPSIVTLQEQLTKYGLLLNDIRLHFTNDSNEHIYCIQRQKATPSNSIFEHKLDLAFFQDKYPDIETRNFFFSSANFLNLFLENH